jgi:hypothetical protein
MVNSEYAARNVNSTYSINLVPVSAGVLRLTENPGPRVTSAAETATALPHSIALVNATNGTTPIKCIVQIKDTTNIRANADHTAGAALTSRPVDADTGGAVVDDATLIGIDDVTIQTLTANNLNDMLVRIVAEWDDMIGVKCPIKNIFIKFTV